MTIDQLWVVIATQINDLYKFPLQPDLDRDDGKYLAPYPDLNMRNPFTLQRYKFDNAQITKEDTKKALENHYVFDEEFSTAQFRQLWEVSNKMHNAEAKLFSGSELGLELWPLPTEKSMENILLYNPEEGEVCFLGRLFIKASRRSSEIVTKLNEMAGSMPYEEIKLHETRILLNGMTHSSPVHSGMKNETRVKFMFGTRLQLCGYFWRSNLSSKRPTFALGKAWSIRLITCLHSQAVHLRNLCTLSLLNKYWKDEQVNSPLMEIVAGNVPELPQEILMVIFALLEIPDLMRAGCVCSAWNSAYTSLRSTGQYKKQQTPCLLYTSESAGENVAHLYSLADKRAYKLTLLELPIHKMYLIGSNHGWLVTVDEHSEMHLVNPITNEQIALPSVITLEQVAPIYDDRGAVCMYHYSMHAGHTFTVPLGKLRYYLHHKALVFYDESAGSYVVVLICNPYGQLSFARLGDEKWTRIPSHKHFQDCIYKDGVLYAVTSFGELIAIDLRGSVFSTKIIIGRVRPRYGTHRVYIAEAPWGDLLQIWRPEVWIKEEVDGHQHKATFENKVGRMQIYKVCIADKKLVQIDSLDGHILFLGNNQSLCSRGDEYLQLKPNHVYFTDDVDGAACNCELGYRLNIGVLNFENKSIEEIIFPRPWSNCLSPLFIIPSLNNLDSVYHI